MIEILKYILAGFSGSIVTYFFCFYWLRHEIRSLIIDKSLTGKPLKIKGTNYFFMTQDQIQKALESLCKFESHGLPDERELNG